MQTTQETKCKVPITLGCSSSTAEYPASGRSGDCRHLAWLESASGVVSASNSCTSRSALTRSEGYRALNYPGRR